MNSHIRNFVYLFIFFLTFFSVASHRSSCVARGIYTYPTNNCHLVRAFPMRGMFRVKNVFAFLTMFHDFIFLEKRVLSLHRWTRKDRNWRQGLFLLVVTAVVVIFFFHVLFSIAIFWTTNILLFFFFFLSPFLRLFYLVQSQSTLRFSYHVFLFICFCKFVDFQITSAFAFSCSRAYYFTHRTSTIFWQLKNSVVVQTNIPCYL